MKKAVTIGTFGMPNKTLKEKFVIAKKAGFDGVELSVDEIGDITLDTSAEEIRAIADSAKECGIEIHSVTGGTFFKYSLASENEESRKLSARYIKKQIEAAKICGADTILFVPGMVDASIAGRQEVIPYDVAYENALSGVKELVPYAEEAGVCLAVENVWNKFLLSPLEMRDFIDECESEFVGAYFDVGNVLQTGFPEHWIKILGGRIKRVHVKDFKAAVGNIMGFVPLLSGSVDYPSVMKALSKIGYDKWLTSEVSPSVYCPEATLYNTSVAMDYIINGK